MLKAGNIFCVAPGHAGTIQSGIDYFSELADPDGQCEYVHTGIITDDKGGTFEALASGYCRQNLLSAYRGCKVLIGRHVDMCDSLHAKGMDAIKGLEGRAYPLWRLFLFAKHPVWPRRIHFKKGVCSEISFQHHCVGGCREINFYWGVAPWYIADAIRRWRIFNQLFEEII
jgi:hypothetical protein